MTGTTGTPVLDVNVVTTKWSTHTFDDVTIEVVEFVWNDGKSTYDMFDKAGNCLEKHGSLTHPPTVAAMAAEAAKIRGI